MDNNKSQKNQHLSTTEMYGNYKVYHPEGKLMFFCDLKKYNWYLKRDLAEVVDGEKKAIKLTFLPNGYGEKPKFLSHYRENKCVVSGETKNLTKHHVVPTQYRQYFPEIYKSKNSNDVVVLTREKHDDYERDADILKADLFNMYITEEEIEYNKDIERGCKIKSTLDRYANDIPDDRQEDLLLRLYEICYKFDVDVDEIYDLTPIDYNKLIVDRMGVEDLIVAWKNHFVDNANPKYLPKWWDPNHIKIIDNRNPTQNEAYYKLHKRKI